VGFSDKLNGVFNRLNSESEASNQKVQDRSIQDPGGSQKKVARLTFWKIL
jgi:hypothetical protein